MSGTRELSKSRLAAIKEAKAKGSLGPFANDPQPPDADKLSPLGKARKAMEMPSMRGLADRKRQEKALKKRGDY